MKIHVHNGVQAISADVIGSCHYYIYRISPNKFHYVLEGLNLELSFNVNFSGIGGFHFYSSLCFMSCLCISFPPNSTFPLILVLFGPLIIFTIYFIKFPHTSFLSTSVSVEALGLTYKALSVGVHFEPKHNSYIIYFLLFDTKNYDQYYSRFF